jgi:hypothetical protein
VSLRDPDFLENQRPLALVDAFFARLQTPGKAPTGGYVEYERSGFEQKFKYLVEGAFRQFLDSAQSSSSKG